MSWMRLPCRAAECIRNVDTKCTGEIHAGEHFEYGV